MKNWRRIPIYWRFYEAYLIAAIVITIFGVITGSDIIIVVFYMLVYGMPVLLLFGFILGIYNFIMGMHDKPKEPMPGKITASDFKGVGKEICDLVKSAIRHSFLFFK